MKILLETEYDKKLCDYYYSVRSKHFHSGEYVFNEFFLNLEMHNDFAFHERAKTFVKFQEQIRKAVVAYINQFILVISA